MICLLFFFFFFLVFQKTISFKFTFQNRFYKEKTFAFCFFSSSRNINNDGFFFPISEFQCKEHLEDGSKCPLSYTSQHSSSASSNASSSGPQSNLTGYSSVASTAFHPVSNVSFPSSVITGGDQLYATNSTSAGQYPLINGYTAALYATNSRNMSQNVRAIAYGANLASKY